MDEHYIIVLLILHIKKDMAIICKPFLKNRIINQELDVVLLL